MKKDEELRQVSFWHNKQVAAGAPTEQVGVKRYSWSLGQLAKYSFTRP